MRRRWISLGAVALLWASASTAAENKAAERVIVAPPSPTSRGGSGGRSGTAKQPMRGPKVPEALRAQMQASLDARVAKNNGKIRALRTEAMGLLEKFVAEAPKDSPELPEALVRLGELHWENEREAHLERLRQWEARPSDQRGPVPDPNYTRARALFGRILSDFPGFADYDLVLYVDAFLAGEQGKEQESLDRFQKILSGYPRSRFVPDAHMAIGESLFSQRHDYQAALPHYEAVLRYKDSDLYGLALFKSAWCSWRLGNSSEAAKKFIGVFQLTESTSAGGSKRRQLEELQRETLKYLVELFSENETNTAADVYKLLTQVGGEKFASKIIKALAETFYDQASYERGIQSYELLLKLEPTSPEAPDWILQIAAGYDALQDYPHLAAAYERALNGYLRGSTWARTQTDPAVVDKAEESISKALYENALRVHAKAQRDKTSRGEYEAARNLYRLYLGKLEKTPRAYWSAFYLGEIEFYHLGQYPDAATHYLFAVRAIPPKEAEKGDLATMRHDALFNALTSLERVRQAQLDARKLKPGQGQAQETDVDRKYAEALDLYAQLYPKDPALPGLFFRQGKVYYDSGVYEVAVKIWGSLLERFPQAPESRNAGELILDSFNRAKDYESIDVWARRMKKAAPFQAPETQKKLDALIVQASFKRGEQKAAAGDHAGAALAYLRAAKEFPMDARAAQAAVNAELEAQKAADTQTLRSAAELAMSPGLRDKPEAPLALWTAATSFQSIGLFGDAAEFDEALAKMSDKEHPHFQKYEHAKDAAYNAVVLRLSTGEFDKAVANGQRYLNAYPSSAESDEVVFLMGKAHQNAGRVREAVDLYKRYLPRSKNADHRVQGYVLLALAQMKLGDQKGADESLAQAVSIGKHQRNSLGAEGKYSAARARYLEGERVLARFEQIQIRGEVKQLGGRLKQKAELLKQSATIFLDTVSMGVAEWSTAALYQIGRSYESFAKSMRDTPIPEQLSEADRDAYQQMIDEFVVPIEERSLDAYENGWKKATELGIYNQWTAKMREALGRLNSELYPPFKEIGFDVRSDGPLTLPPLLDGPVQATPAQATPSTQATAANKSKGAK